MFAVNIYRQPVIKNKQIGQMTKFRWIEMKLENKPEIKIGFFLNVSIYFTDNWSRNRSQKTLFIGFY